MAPAHPAQGRAPGHANAPEVGNSDRQVVRKIFQRAVLDVAGNGRGHELLHRVRRGQVVRTTPNSALIFPSFHVSDRFLLTGERVAGEAVEYVEPAKVSGLVHPRLCVSAYDLAADEAHSFFSFTMRSGGGGTLSASMPRSCKNIATSSMVRYSTFSCPSSSSSGRTPTLPSSRSQTAMIAAKMPCPSFFSRPFSSCSSAPMVAWSIKFFTTRWSLVRSTPFLSFSERCAKCQRPAREADRRARRRKWASNLLSLSARRPPGFAERALWCHHTPLVRRAAVLIVLDP